MDNLSGNGNGERLRLLPRITFNPAINLGYILQIIALAGAVLTAYVGMQRDMETQRAEFRVAMASFVRG